MIRALFSAASGMTAQQLNIDNIANNLANANTAGYTINGKNIGNNQFVVYVQRVF